MATELAISSCEICCDDDALVFENEGIFRCCKGMRSNCCIGCAKRLCNDKAQCPFCRSILSREIVVAIVESEPPVENPSQVEGLDGFFNGVYQGDLDDDEISSSIFSEASLVEEEEVVEEESDHYQEHFVDPIDARRACIPCWNHFGRNGRLLVGGCSIHGCPYAHVVQVCRYGRACNRRATCRFWHN